MGDDRRMTEDDKARLIAIKKDIQVVRSNNTSLRNAQANVDAARKKKREKSK